MTKVLQLWAERIETPTGKMLIVSLTNRSRAMAEVSNANAGY